MQVIWKTSSLVIDSADIRQEFMAQISIGLLKPSGVVYIICIHTFALYNAIKNNSESFSLLLKSSNVFTTYFSNLIEESNCLTSFKFMYKS